MGNLAIIPARGGSKRIPGKNIKDFLGLPIIVYSIKAALQSGLFEDVMVSTDSDEIAAVAKKYGAIVPFFRSAANSSDFATTMQVLIEVEQDYRIKLGRSFDFICCIYPTAPLITPEHLKEGFGLVQSGFDAVFPVVPFSYPVWRGLEIVDGRTKMLWPEHSTARSQDLKPVYHDAGQWYWYDSQKIKDSIFTDNVSSVILSELEVQDIDTLTDWKLAEMKYKLRNAV